jgi:hypothetical protein
VSDGRWAVHVLGPDELHYVEGGMSVAMDLAHYLNARVLPPFVANNPDYLIWAVPVPPNNTAAIVRKQ